MGDEAQAAGIAYSFLQLSFFQFHNCPSLSLLSFTYHYLDEESVNQLKELFTQLTDSWGETTYNEIKDHALLRLGAVVRKELSFMQVVKDSPIFLDVSPVI